MERSRIPGLSARSATGGRVRLRDLGVTARSGVVLLAVAALAVAQAAPGSGAGSSPRATPDPLCPAGYSFDYGRASCVKAEGPVPAVASCPGAGPGEQVRLSGTQCVTTRTETADREATCPDDPDDPPAWTLSGSQCSRTVEEIYQEQTGRVRVAPFSERVRVAPLTERVRVPPLSERVRVAPFSERVRVAPLTERVRVPPLSERVRVAPFSERVRVAPFTQRVRVAPFTRRVTVRVPYTYTVRVRDRCLRRDYRSSRCIAWRYRSVSRTGYRNARRVIAAYNYETRPVYNYRVRAVYNYKNRAVFNYETRDVFNYETRAVFNYENRDVFNYEDRAVFNYEDRDVFNYEDRAVFNYEDRDVFNYEDRDVFNYEPVYETRTRQVVQTRSPDIACPDGFDSVQGSDSCSKQTVMTASAIFECPSQYSTKLPNFMCMQVLIRDPTGCPRRHLDSRYTLEKVASISSPSIFGWYCKPLGTASFGPPAGGRFANDSRHTYKSAETNDNEHKLWHHRFAGPGGERIYNRTDLTLVGLPRSSLQPADVMWSVDNIDVLASYSCITPVSSEVCGYGRIRIKSDAHEMNDDLLENNLVCHELGHSIGFGHGSSRTSCMTSGDNNVLDAWEVRAINLKY
jgi:hypothetical protein